MAINLVHDVDALEAIRRSLNDVVAHLGEVQTARVKVGEVGMGGQSAKRAVDDFVNRGSEGNDRIVAAVSDAAQKIRAAIESYQKIEDDVRAAGEISL